VSSPNPSQFGDILSGIADVSPTDAWAVGQYRNLRNRTKVLIEHWDGSAWSVVATPPNGGKHGASLAAITAVSATNIWAVGTASPSVGTQQTLIEHWNGRGWKIVPSPNTMSSYNVLDSVTANNAHDVWASGTSRLPSDGGQTLAEHWDGSSWSIVPTPNISNDDGFDAIAAIAPSRVYAVGDFVGSSNFESLAEFWNGSTWSIQSSPNRGFKTFISGIAGSRMEGAIAVGEYFSTNFAQTFAMKITPRGWTIVQSADVGPYDSFFNGAGAIPGTADVWGAGGTTNSDHSNHNTLIELFSCS